MDPADAKKDRGCDFSNYKATKMFNTKYMPVLWLGSRSYIINLFRILVSIKSYGFISIQISPIHLLLFFCLLV